jgi:hypothetical protein
MLIIVRLPHLTGRKSVAGKTVAVLPVCELENAENLCDNS